MREIKFRAWDKENKEMHHGNLLGSYGNFKEYTLWGDVKGVITVNPDELMQYTGLKDKNGKEIYEGDLIQDNLGYGAVEYRETRAGFRLNYVDGLAKWFLDYTDDEFKTIEVIGNIYQTPAEVTP